MSFFSRLFGSEKAVGGIVKGVDAAFFTKEEKAEHFLRILKAYEPFKLAQRFLALIVGIPYVVVWVICAVTMFFTDTSKVVAEWNNETLGTPFALILAFYFGGGAVEGIIRSKNGKD